MIRQPRWKPDTCGCKVTYKWDDEKHSSVPLGVLDSASLVDEVIPCEEHQGGTMAEQYEAIVGKNQKKNLSVTEALKVLELPDDTWVPWRFEKKGLILTIEDKGKTQDVKDQLSAKGLEVIIE